MRVAEEMERSNLRWQRCWMRCSTTYACCRRAEAFENLGRCSTTDGLRRFATMVNQSLQHGTALAHVLKQIAEELRRRIIKLEERAHKLGVKLIVPMVIFLMPAMFVVWAAVRSCTSSMLSGGWHEHDHLRGQAPA